MAEGRAQGTVQGQGQDMAGQGRKGCGKQARRGREGRGRTERRRIGNGRTRQSTVLKAHEESPEVA